MAKISNTISYPGQSPIEGADYLIGTAANSTPIGLQTKTFTIQGIADFIIDAAFEGVENKDDKCSSDKIAIDSNIVNIKDYITKVGLEPTTNGL